MKYWQTIGLMSLTLLVACGSSDDEGNGTAGTGGATAGSGGSAGTGGSAGSSGTGGASTGGTAGSPMGGTGGGTAGTAGAGGGTAGTAGAPSECPPWTCNCDDRVAFIVTAIEKVDGTCDGETACESTCESHDGVLKTTEGMSCVNDTECASDFIWCNCSGGTVTTAVGSECDTALGICFPSVAFANQKCETKCAGLGAELRDCTMIPEICPSVACECGGNLLELVSSACQGDGTCSATSSDCTGACQ